MRNPETGRPSSMNSLSTWQKRQETREAGFEEGSLCLFMNLPAIYLGVKKPHSSPQRPAWRRRNGPPLGDILLNGQVRTVLMRWLRPVENDGEE